MIFIQRKQNNSFFKAFSQNIQSNFVVMCNFKKWIFEKTPLHLLNLHYVIFRLLGMFMLLFTKESHLNFTQNKMGFKQIKTSSRNLFWTYKITSPKKLLTRFTVSRTISNSVDETENNFSLREALFQTKQQENNSVDFILSFILQVELWKKRKVRFLLSSRI